MFTWIPLPHLPQPPEEFLELARKLCHEDTEWNAVAHLQGDTGYRSRKLIMQDGTEVPTRFQKGYLMGKAWETWVRENITTNFYETGARSSAGVPIHGAHSDAPPKWKLYYLVDRGGDDAVTHFYKERGQPVERLNSLEGKLIHVNDYRQLDIIDSVQWPLHQWVLMNGTVLHGVEGLGEEMRINLTVAFKPHTMDLTIVTDKDRL
jgi:hypothetical protein